MQNTHIDERPPRRDEPGVLDAHVHTGDFLEHSVAHELLEAVGVEARSVHWNSVLQSEKQVFSSMRQEMQLNKNNFKEKVRYVVYYTNKNDFIFIISYF